MKRKTLIYRKRISGLAVVELTLMLPFLLLIIFSVAEFSRMLYQYNALNKFARDAARYMSVHAVNGTTSTVDLSLARDEVLALFIHGDTSASQELLPGLSADNITTITLSTTGNFVTISVSYHWQPMIFTSLPHFITNDSTNLGFPLTVNYTMRALGA
ncbi:TadE/TadG family type IV pilus assembly protein [Thalassotalea aquiviva]|uniref:TadE/TadG family type IV pilus assembly protein n=1 Tax=Thalassotalea aquiviva TaxID=3242415 RepID=UPI00352A4333